jgi:hypothetical protein
MKGYLKIMNLKENKKICKKIIKFIKKNRILRYKD